jgi:hypothetical protein
MEEHAALLSLLTGPTSSLVLLLGMLWGVWRMIQGLIPTGKAWVDQHLNQVDTLLAQHQADREAWLASMRDGSAQHQEVITSLDRIERKVGGLYSRLPVKAD